MAARSRPSVRAVCVGAAASLRFADGREERTAIDKRAVEGTLASRVERTTYYHLAEQERRTRTADGQMETSTSSRSTTLGCSPWEVSSWPRCRAAPSEPLHRTLEQV